MGCREETYLQDLDDFYDISFVLRFCLLIDFSLCFLHARLNAIALLLFAWITDPQVGE